MTSPMAPVVARALFGLAARAFPAEHREAGGREMREAFALAAGARFSTGALAGWRFTLKACADVLRQGWLERRRGGRLPDGHGRHHGNRGGGGMAGGIGLDLRMAVRTLRRAPAFSAAALVVLALGIGANATIYSAVRAVVLAPPPYPDAESLVLADLTVQRAPERPADPLIWSFPKYRTFLEAEGRLIDPAVGYAERSVTLTEAGPAEVIPIELVAPGYFALVGAEPSVGRAFVEGELEPADAGVAVLSHALWHERFEGSPSALGQSITLNGAPFTVVGVAPEGFDGITGGAVAWLPLGAAGDVMSPVMVEEAGAHWFHVLGRLVPGATLADARAQMEGVGDLVDERYPAPNPSRVYSASVRPLSEVRANPRARDSVLFLSLAAGLLLLVACANLSGLLVARGRARARDRAVRRAIGASRGRLVRASMVESLVLSTLGGVAGLATAMAGTAAMAAVWPARFSGGDAGLRVSDPSAFGVGGEVVLFIALMTLTTGVLFGLVPAIGAARPGLLDGLRDGTGATRATRRIAGLDARGFLVGAQIALALVLVIGVGLVSESTRRLLAVDEGFRTERLLTFSYTIPTTSSRIEDPLSFHDEFLAEIRGLPTVTAATFGCAPLRGHCILTRVDAIRDEPEIPQGEGLQIGVQMVDDVHFEALGIPVSAGRVFDTRDGTDRVPSVVINDFAARSLFGDRPAVGRFIELGVGSSDKDPMAEVIGVVGDVLYDRPESGVTAEAYYSYREWPENHGNITVRTSGEPLAIVDDLHRTLARVEPSLALYRMETMERIMADSVGDRRTVLGLLGVFAAVTLLLAVIGTWSLVAFLVADRRRELGLRLALGANEGRLLRSVVGEGLRAGLFGVAAGIVAGLSVSRLLEQLLWETEPTEPVIYLLGAALLIATVLVASWLPARRVLEVDPVEALRAE